MIALLLALAGNPPPPPSPPPPPPSIDGLPIAGLPRQSLPDRGCAAYLFSAGQTRTLAAVATADPPTLRIALDGKVADYPRAAQAGVGALGLSGTTVYHAGDVTATLDMTIATPADLLDGAAVPAATLRIERPGRDGLVLPLGGLIGCAKQAA